MSISRICLTIVAYSCTFSVLLVGAAEPADTPDYVAGKLIVFNDNGAWSWYSDERAIVDPGSRRDFHLGAAAASNGLMKP